MIDEQFRNFIVDNYARRIKIWLTSFGITLVIIGFVVLYDNLGFWEPVRFRFDADRLRWWTLAIFSFSAGAAAASFALGFMLKWGVRVVINNPLSFVTKTQNEIKEAVVKALTSKMISLESSLWLIAGIPAILGSVLFAVGRSPRVMFLYLGISLVIGAIFIPTLEQTEEFFAKRLNEIYIASETRILDEKK